MDLLLESQHTSSGLVAVLVVILCLHLLAQIGKFVFELLRKKSDGTDRKINEISLQMSQNTNEVRELARELRVQLGQLQREVAEIQRFKSDINKVFSAIKFIAGPRWPKVRKAMEDDILLK